MLTANISHPNDPNGDGKPPTVVVRKFNRIEAMRLKQDISKRQAFQVVGTNRVVIRNSDEVDDVSDPMFVFYAIKKIVTAVLNAPPDADGKPLPFGDECLLQLFDEKYDVLMKTVAGRIVAVTDGTAAEASISFPLYIIREYSKPDMFPDPTPAQSASS